MAYVIADNDYARLVEDLAYLVVDFAEPVAAGAPVDLDTIKLRLALAGGVYPASCASDPSFD